MLPRAPGPAGSCRQHRSVPLGPLSPALESGFQRFPLHSAQPGSRNTADIGEPATACGTRGQSDQRLVAHHTKQRTIELARRLIAYLCQLAQHREAAGIKLADALHAQPRFLVLPPTLPAYLLQTLELLGGPFRTAQLIELCLEDRRELDQMTGVQHRVSGHLFGQRPDRPVGPLEPLVELHAQIARQEIGQAGGGDESTVIRLKRVVTDEGTTFVTRPADEAQALAATVPADTAPVNPDPLTIRPAALTTTANVAPATGTAAAPAGPAVPAASPDGRRTLLTYQLGVAGDVTLAVSATGLEIDSISPADGWAVVRSESGGGIATVWLRGGQEELRFTAKEVDGEIEVDLVSAALDSAVSAVADAARTTFEVADAGFVTLEVLDGRLTIVGAEAKDGWRVAEREQEKAKIEVEFKGTGGKLEFKARLMDGEIVTFLEEERSKEDEDEHDEHDEHDDD